MPDVPDRDLESVRASLRQIPSSERSAHRGLITRNIDFLIEVLWAEQASRKRHLPAGCPRALPMATARRRERTGGVFPCSFESAQRSPGGGPVCPCGDPLQGSDDPLDAAAAVVLGSPERSGSKRYFDTEWRSVVATLRDEAGEWEAIAAFEDERLKEALDSATGRRAVAEHRVSRLADALAYFDAHRYTDGVTLNGLPRVTYERLARFLEGCPGIGGRDAWWLILTALDKPVWPSDPAIDTLLADLGLLHPRQLPDESPHRESMEELLTDRQHSTLHRALAGHALKAAPSWCGNDCEIRKFSLLYRSSLQRERSGGPAVVDLFSGAGGLSSGFKRAGARIALAVDSDRTASDTYRLNHPEIPHERVLCRGIEEILEGDVPASVAVDDVDIVIGGPPCQSLSQAGYRARLASDDGYSILDDPRTELYRSYVEMVERLDPAVIVMENVEGIINEVGDSDIRVLDQIRKSIEARGYSCHARLLDCSAFGIPQRRERVILIGMKTDLAPSAAVVEGIFRTLQERAPDARYSMKQGLAGLPRLRRGEGGNAISERRAGPLGEYLSRHELRGRTCLAFNHQAREHPMEKDRELFDSVMEPGDTGWSVKHEKGRDDLIEYDVGTADDPRFIDKYRMLHWDEPAPTVVAHLAKDANNFVIPDYYSYVQRDPDRQDPRRNRGVTPREAARLQSFPDDYIFLGPYTSQFRQIGNAVPPALGHQLGSVLVELLSISTSPARPRATGTDATGSATGD